MNLQPEPSCHHHHHHHHHQAAPNFSSNHRQHQYPEVCPSAYQGSDQYLGKSGAHQHHNNACFGPPNHQPHVQHVYTANQAHQANLAQGSNWSQMELVAPASASASSSNSLLSPSQQEQDTSGMMLSQEADMSLQLEAPHHLQTPPEKIIQRVKANKKERRRTQSINQAFSELRRHIPDVPSDTKLSKIKTLRLAISYISHLMSTLDEDQEKPAQDLDHVGATKAIAQSQHQHQLQQRVAPVVGLTVSGDNRARCERSCNKDRKHRTGWPEIVWKSAGSFKTRLEVGPRQVR